MKLTFYSDAGHGWLAAKRALVNELGLADKISQYSHQLGGTVYLEEDCDAPLLLDALKARGIKPEVVHGTYRERAPIRGYARYTKEA